MYKLLLKTCFSNVFLRFWFENSFLINSNVISLRIEWQKKMKSQRIRKKSRGWDDDLRFLKRRRINWKLCPFHRCKVPECDIGDNNREISYDQPWLSHAIPSSSNGFESCVRYALKNVSSSGPQCSADHFDTSKQIKCSEYIYSSDEKNVQTEVPNN